MHVPVTIFCSSSHGDCISHFDLSLQPTSVAYTLLSAALYSLPVERLVEVGISFAEVQVRGASLALQTRQVGLQVASGAFSFVQYLFAGLVTGSGVLYENSGWFFSAIAWAWSCLVTFAFFLCRCCAERRRWLTTLTFPKVKMFGWGAAVVPPVAAGGGLPGAGGPVVGAPVVVAPVGAAVPGAIVAAGGGGGAVPIPIGPPPGDFLLLARGAEWDEVMVTYLLSPTRWLCRTTNADGSAFISALFMPQPGMMRAPVNMGGPRVAPHGVPANSINWICTPPAAAAVWVPGAPELTQVLAEATLLAAALQAHGEPPGYATKPNYFPISYSLAEEFLMREPSRVLRRSARARSPTRTHPPSPSLKPCAVGLSALYLMVLVY